MINPQGFRIVPLTNNQVTGASSCYISVWISLDFSWGDVPSVSSAGTLNISLPEKLRNKGNNES